jgi:hypothetical protein
MRRTSTDASQEDKLRLEDAAQEDKLRLQHSKTHHIAIQQGAHHNARRRGV